MNIIDELLSNRKLFAGISILAIFSVTGLILASYYQSQAKASDVDLPVVAEFIEYDYSDFENNLAAPTIDYTNTSKNPGTITDDNSEPAKPVESIISGDYLGTNSSLFGPEFKFAKSSLSVSNTQNFSFSGEGLDLSVVGIPSLMVNGQYPKVYSKIIGSFIQITNSKLIQLKITQIQTEFRIENQVLDPQTSNNISSTLEAAGIVLPLPSKAIPIFTQASLNANENQLNIESVSDSSFKFVFTGSKESK
jgi:hypothetical protein